jgi:phage-related protein
VILKLQEFNFDVKFYEDKNGKMPIKEFIENLEKNGEIKRADKIYTYLRSLSKYGTRIGYPYIRHIEGDIWELRPFDDRIFFFFWKDNKFVLVHHYLKKTNKTPKREIKQAEKNMLDYLERNE